MAFPSVAKQALEKLKQGPVQVVFDPGSANEVEVFVKGGFTLNVERNLAAAETDLVGVYDMFSQGETATFELKMDETSHNVAKVVFLDQVQAASYVGIGQAAGISSRGVALDVRIRPWQTRMAATLQVELWLAVPDGNAAKSMTPGEPWSFTQSFKCLPDLSKANGELIGKITFPARS